ncbi:hypothetical protein [Aquabacterium humicola]|uniref:hypothetical protein n=1 Tax=Aquabacterium humicola TaxID=3237377 RepID=UPI002542E502|nr:hypothetical protein [Rubrivivax pictus]
MSVPRFVDRLVVVTCHLCALLFGIAMAPAFAAECAQITTWSNQDASYFPVERSTRIEHSNTPGPNYFDLDSVQERTLLTTFFLMVASPAKTADQRFANNVSVTVMSFRSQADATAMFQREVATFNNINPYRWGYKVLAAAEGQQMIFYDDTPGEQDIHFLAPRHNTIIQITIKSASPSEDMLTLGVARLTDRIVQARALVDRKCNFNNPPSIRLRDAQADLPASVFQSEMANGEIVFTAMDRDGSSDIDWNTFRVFVAGIDKTAHVLTVVNRLAQAGRVEYTEFAPNEVVYRLRLDRYRLMGDHNVFNIAWNGEWPVDLRICDRKGSCTTSSYKLNFGPYIHVSSFEDLRCSSNGADQRMRLKVSFGNNGWSATANIYAVIGPATPWQAWSRNYWSLSLVEPISQNVLQWFSDSYGMVPVFVGAPIDLPTALTVPDNDELELLVSTAANVRGGQTVSIPAGTYTLATGAVDLNQNSLAVQSRGVTLCASR